MSYVPLEYRTIEGEPHKRQQTKARPVPMPDGSIKESPVDFVWNGSSVPWFLKGTFPRWRHPIASHDHDFGCADAKNKEERKWHDDRFEENVGKTSWWITKKWGWLGVRAGAALGIGNNFKENKHAATEEI